MLNYFVRRTNVSLTKLETFALARHIISSHKHQVCTTDYIILFCQYTDCQVSDNLPWQFCTNCHESVKEIISFNLECTNCLLFFSFLWACILASQGQIMIVISYTVIQVWNVTERMCRLSQTQDHSVCPASTLFCTSKPKSCLFTLASSYLGMQVKKPFNIKMLINSISLPAAQLRYFADAFSSYLVCLYKVCKAIQGPSVLRLLG